MTNTNTAAAERSYRLRNVLLLMPTVVIVAGLYYAIEASLAGGDIEQVEKVVLAKIPAVLFLSIVLGGTYIFSKSRPRLPRWLSWQTIAASSYLGAVLFAAIYLVATQDYLHSMLGAGFDFAISEALPKRILLGMMEGLLWGGVIGLWICSVDVRATLFTRKGMARYVAWYSLPVLAFTIPLIIFGTFWLSIAMLGLGGMFSAWRQNAKIDGKLQQLNADKS